MSVFIAAYLVLFGAQEGLALGFVDVLFNFKRGDSILVVAAKTDEKGNVKDR